MEIIPLGRKILLKRVEASKNIGGIIVPKTVEEKTKIYEVVTISEAAKIVTLNNVPTRNIEIGDKVLIKNFIGLEVFDKDIEYAIVDKEDIVAIIQ